jgi:hypothetical protein
MEVTYQLTADDFRHGMIAWRMRSRWRRWSYRFGLAVMPPILVFSAIMLVAYPHSELRQGLWIMFGASVFWLAYIWTMPWLSARIQFRRMPSAQDPITLAVSDSGLHMQSRHADSQIAWTAFIGWREEKSVFVVFPQPSTYAPIPKRAFTEEQQAEFRETLRRNIVPFKSK